MSSQSNVVAFYPTPLGGEEIGSTPLPEPFGKIRRLRMVDGVVVSGDPSPGSADSGVSNSQAEKEPSVDIGELIAQARAEEAASAAVALEEAMRQKDSEHAEALAAERARWVEAVASQFSVGLEASIAALRQTIEDKLSAVLEPFVIDEFARQALDEASSLIDDSFNVGGEVAICISGPQEMVEALSDRVGKRAASLKVVNNEDMDVSVVINDALIETRLSEWMARLKDSMRGE